MNSKNPAIVLYIEKTVFVEETEGRFDGVSDFRVVEEQVEKSEKIGVGIG